MEDRRWRTAANGISIHGAVVYGDSGAAIVAVATGRPSAAAGFGDHKISGVG